MGVHIELYGSYMDDEISGWECILGCKDLIWTVKLVDGSAY